MFKKRFIVVVGILLTLALVYYVLVVVLVQGIR